MIKEDLVILYCIIIVMVVVVFAIGFAVDRFIYLHRALKDMRIRVYTMQREQEKQYKSLVDQIKQQTDKPHALNELQQLFSAKMSKIRRQYPSLTDADAQVLLLIGLGVENHEILSLTDMSKRTYYKRRQVIAPVVGQPRQFNGYQFCAFNRHFNHGDCDFSTVLSPYP